MMGSKVRQAVSIVAARLKMRDAPAHLPNIYGINWVVQNLIAEIVGTSAEDMDRLKTYLKDCDGIQLIAPAYFSALHFPDAGAPSASDILSVIEKAIGRISVEPSLLVRCWNYHVAVLGLTALTELRSNHVIRLRCRLSQFHKLLCETLHGGEVQLFTGTSGECVNFSECHE